MDYLVTKSGEDINQLDLNGIFSIIYGPIVPSSKRMETTCYEKNQDKFKVSPFEEGSIISGKVSKDLIEKLSNFGISLQRFK